MMFHVFVEGAKDATPEGVQRLADAIGAHYGLPAADLRTRITAGRFRVKGNVDRPTAEQYVRDLDRLGARCAIEEASPQNSRPTPLPFPAVRPPTPLPIAAAPAARPSQPQGAYASGLSAAFSGDSPAASLGALEQGDIPLSLASVDGSEASGAPAASSTFEPPATSMPASIGPAPTKAKAPEKKPARPKDEPIDLFVPPEVADGALSVDLAPEEVERSARKRASTPPASVPVVAAPAKQAAIAQDAAIRRPGGSPLADPRVRFAAGVVLAILIGFVPAHFIAAMRERSAFDAVDNKIIAAQQQADTPDEYATLDQLREEQLGRKQGDRRSIAIMAMLIWGAVGGAAAYGWFRKIPWERLES